MPTLTELLCTAVAGGNLKPVEVRQQCPELGTPGKASPAEAVLL